jgi:ABC transport system ATP-binding/permease protein
MTPVVSCQNISKSYGGRPLFDGISLTIGDDERVGLIGPNGAGKSTLMKILAGFETPDEGDRVLSQGVQMAYLPQVDRFTNGMTVEQILVEALADKPMESFERTTEAAIMLGKLGFDNPEQLVDTLSGGWRKRLAIGRVLVREPSLVFLDEPTNHLDLEGILWLEDLLRNAPFAFVVVSHDRYFLENAVNRIIELNRRYPDGYFSTPGSYGDFLLKREEYFASQDKQQDALANKVRREVEWLHRGAKARTRKAQSRIDEAGRMISDLSDMKTRSNENRTVNIDFAGTERKTKELIVAEKVTRTIDGRNLFEDVTLTLSPGMRLGLIGRNGSGKTTFLRLLAGLVKPDKGTVRHATTLRLAVFDQQREELNLDETLRRTLAPSGDAVIYRDQQVHVMSWAKRFLFRPEQMDRPVRDLSGGEQARLLIARLMLLPCDVLMLDEPTNDLDIATLELLEESLIEFPGAVVLITHDRYMLDRVSSVLLGLDGEGGAVAYADVAQWQAAGKAAEVEAKEAAARVRKTAAGGPSGAPVRKKKVSYKEQKEWEGMEAAIHAAEETLARHKQALEDPAKATDAKHLQTCAKEIAAAQAVLDALFARWAELEIVIKESQETLT